MAFLYFKKALANLYQYFPLYLLVAKLGNQEVNSKISINLTGFTLYLVVKHQESLGCENE